MFLNVNIYSWHRIIKMKRFFRYIELNGLFRYWGRFDAHFYKGHKLSYEVSTELDNGAKWFGYYIFSPDEKSWVADWSAPPPHYISFCLNKGLFEPIGYEIKTSNGKSLPSVWSFSGSMSMDGPWENNITTCHNISSNSNYYVNWSHGNYTCFRLDTLKRTGSDHKTFDIDFLELYGTLYDEDMTLQYKNRHYISILCAFIFTIK